MTVRTQTPAASGSRTRVAARASRSSSSTGSGTTVFGWGTLARPACRGIFASSCSTVAASATATCPKGRTRCLRWPPTSSPCSMPRASEQANVFGVSLGGYIAQELVLAYRNGFESSCSALPRRAGPESHPMPAPGLEAFGRFPTMEREAGLRLMVENSLGERAVRERPDSSTRSTRTGSTRAPTIEGWQAQRVAGAPSTAFDRRPGDRGTDARAPRAAATTSIDHAERELLAERIPMRGSTGPRPGPPARLEEGDRLASIVKEFLES